MSLILNEHPAGILRPQLPSPRWIVICSAPLDFNEARGSRRERVAAALREAIGLRDKERLVFAEQTHGATVAGVDAVLDCPEPEAGFREIAGCDGLWTENSGRALVVRTADCVPVVVSDARRPFIGAVHAGWRGTLGAILDRMIECALGRGSLPGDLHVWIGPHIQLENYEVSPDLCQQFEDRFGHLGEITRGRLLDLGRTNRLQAIARGIPGANIRHSGICTFDSGGVFPSYRRDGECRGQIYTAVLMRD